jgi:hypothetical protein
VKKKLKLFWLNNLSLPNPEKLTSSFKSSSKMSHRNTKPTVVRKPCCKVCKDAGKSESEYGSHWPKDSDGKTVCPTLLAQDCRYCGEAGHTVKYCKVLERDNANKEKRQKQEERLRRIQAHEVASKPKSLAAVATTGRFAMLMDDDSSDESPRSPKRTQKKALVALKEEFPALGGTWRKSSVAPEVAKTSFMEMAVKSIAEKQTRETRAEEERLGRAIATGMVIIERGSKGVVMTAPPKTAKQLEMEREKAVHRAECFKGLNGKGWGDLDSDDEEEDQLEQVAEDAW